MSVSPAQAMSLDEEATDDLLYLTRAGDVSELTSLLTSLSTTHSVPAHTILLSAVDPTSLNTPLHYAAANGHLPITQHLVSLLPDISASDTSEARSKIINAQNEAGNTPLHWAALNGHLEVVKALVEAGADPGVKNKVQRSVLVEAEIAGGEKAGECVNWLLGHWEGAEEGNGAAMGGADGSGEGSVDGGDIAAHNGAGGVNGVTGSMENGHKTL
ncbi:Ankyrin repeat-containing protein P16F5.05c [Cyphellophora attinorum]|uniref:Ankyrin repeat-containing protein P16F5.05c n=1 Tax=Cyphellophora attinorum TaxID=1664694 RepID=A0A0N1NYR4_9EURO|nr:Ankyrin repeat-containing protein P16F5.05c [Phialophora attinorum]KPI36454.1 Ankyrin repeat-containing protein P16F5.05c [Phialophora attinorum]